MLRTARESLVAGRREPIREFDFAVLVPLSAEITAYVSSEDREAMGPQRIAATRRFMQSRCSMISGPSSQGRRQVLVYKLDGGRPITGVIKGLSKSGLSLALPTSLMSGEVVRLILPPSDRRPSASGRTIIGHVVGPGTGTAGNVFGIDFAWEVGLDAGSRRSDPGTARSWWRRLFSRKSSTARPKNPSVASRGTSKPR